MVERNKDGPLTLRPCKSSVSVTEHPYRKRKKRLNLDRLNLSVSLSQITVKVNFACNRLELLSIPYYYFL